MSYLKHTNLNRLESHVDRPTEFSSLVGSYHIWSPGCCFGPIDVLKCSLLLFLISGIMSWCLLIEKVIKLILVRSPGPFWFSIWFRNSLVLVQHQTITFTPKNSKLIQQQSTCRNVFFIPDRTPEEKAEWRELVKVLRAKVNDEPQSLYKEQ